MGWTKTAENLTMKIIIPTKGRHTTICTHIVFPSAYILVHDNKECSMYIKNMSIEHDRIIVTSTEKGKSRQMEWASDNLIDINEWFIFADDDIRYIECLPEPWYWEDKIQLPPKCSKMWRHRYQEECDPTFFLSTIVPDMIERAERIGTGLCGFAMNDNYYFRSRHWRNVGYVGGGLTITKNCGIPYNHSITMEDFTITAEHLLRFGAVLINNYARPVTIGNYSVGGHGTYNERANRRVKDCSMLMSLYPRLFRIRDRKGFVRGTDLAVRLHSEKQIEAWRASMRNPLRRAKRW